MLTKLFYLMACIPLTIELICALHPITVLKARLMFRINIIPSMTFNQSFFILGSMFSYLWNFIGLFSSQRLLFSILFLSSICFDRLRKNVPLIREAQISMLTGIVSLLLISLIIINKFN